MPELENMYYERGFETIAGIDEAGRGPLAGPVCAAAVILPKGMVIEGVDDSKKISEKKREALYDKIIDAAVAYSVVFVHPDVIDEINIRQATHKAMQEAADGLKIKPELLLVDGNDGIPFEGFESEYVIKGDSKLECIAAASIIAKVTRDRYMREMDEKYPDYGFAKHKGYGTKAHMEAIQEIGICPLHRKSFMTDKVLGKVK